VGWKEEDKGEGDKDEEGEEMTVEEEAEEGEAGKEEMMEEELKEERRKAVVDMEGRTERKLPVSCCRSHIEPKPALPRVRTKRKGAKRYEARREVVVRAGGVETVGATGAAISDIMLGKAPSTRAG